MKCCKCILLLLALFFILLLPPPSSTLFPYTTLFRSRRKLPLRVASPKDRRARRHHALQSAASFEVDILDVCARSEEHTSELQSPDHLVCRLLLEKKKTIDITVIATIHNSNNTYHDKN